MTQNEMLQKLLDKAVENGWNDKSKAVMSARVVTTFKELMIGIKSAGMGQGNNLVTLSELLFSDNLSFLKALFGDSEQEYSNNITSDWTDLYNFEILGGRLSIADSNTLFHFTTTAVNSASQELVILPDDKRIPYLYGLIFGK